MAKRHFLAGYHIKSSTGSVTPTVLQKALGSFVAAVSGQVLDVSADQRVIKLHDYHSKKQNARVIIETGHYGTDCAIVDRSTGAHSYHRKHDDADLIPLHAVFDFGAQVPGPLAVFHRFGQLGARTSLEQQFNAHLAKSNAGFRTEFAPVGPGQALRTWLQTGRLAKITLHRRDAGPDKVGELELVQSELQNSAGRRRRKLPSKAIDRTLIIEARWGYWKLTHALRELFQSDDADAASIAEVVGERAFQPSNADVTIDTGDRQRTFRIGSAFRINEDITERVQRPKNEYPTSASIFAEAFDYLAVIARPIGAGA